MSSKFEELTEVIFKQITPKLENNSGLAIFAKERAKFEGWLKVELCETLSKHFQTIVPEKDRIDITFDDWAIELKTVTTNYRYENVDNNTIQPITEEIDDVINDIENLAEKNYINKAILFVVFPVTHDHKDWKTHLNRICKLLKEKKYREFKFKNKVPGVIYFGSI